MASGFIFTDKTINVLEKPDWVTAVRVDSSGNLVVVPKTGLMILIK